MNITYLVGNGFDLSYGFKTRASEFLTYYARIRSPNPKVQRIKTFLDIERRGAIDTWHDLEVGLNRLLGKVCDTVADVPNFIMFLEDFMKALSDYLANEVNSRELCECSIEQREKFWRRLTQPESFLQPARGELLTKTITGSKIESNYNLRFINFNYTNLLDKYLECISVANGISQPKYRSIHIHGTVYESMILGINDIDFLARKELLTDDLAKAFIKPIMNRSIDDPREANALNWISVSDIIVVYGMSLSVTDLIWWRAIFDRLRTCTHSQFIYCAYGKDGDRRWALDYSKAQTKLHDDICAQLKLSDNDYNSLMQQIHVAWNEEVFSRVKVKLNDGSKEMKV